MQPCFVNESRENKFEAPTLLTSSSRSSMSRLQQSPVPSERTHRRCDMRVVAERNCHATLKCRPIVANGLAPKVKGVIFQKQGRGRTRRFATVDVAQGNLLEIGEQLNECS